MVKGIDVFRDYFRDYTDEYVLIGGAACDISFQDYGSDFRATKDLDMVLIVEALNSEFGERFWEFIRDGGYQNRAKSSEIPQFYRFDKPSAAGFPSMIELFARADWILDNRTELMPIHIDDRLSSLSAILLNASYYKLLLDGRVTVDGFSVLKPSCLIPFKAKAWIDLNQRAQAGEHVDSRDMKKHKNDIIRLASELPLDRCELPEEIRADMLTFIALTEITQQDIRNMGIKGVTAEEIIQILLSTYNI